MKETFQELTDSQWQLIEKIVDDKRQRWHSLRTIINAILWLNYTGLQWRQLAKLSAVYPSWQTVYYHFRQFKRRGIWEQVLDSLVVAERKRQRRNGTPSLLEIDSQSVRIMQFINEETGLDANNEAGQLVVDQLRGKVPRLAMIAADHGYKLTFIDYVEQSCGWRVEIAQKPETGRGFVPEKNRWPVERSFSWLNFRCRLFRDVEKTVESSPGRRCGGHATNCLYLDSGQ